MYVLTVAERVMYDAGHIMAEISFVFIQQGGGCMRKHMRTMCVCVRVAEQVAYNMTERAHIGFIM